MKNHPIHLDDRRYGGLLDWVELALSRPELDLPMELFVDTSPVGMTPRQESAWLVKELRNQCNCAFLRPLVHPARGLRWTTDQAIEWPSGTKIIVGRMNAASLFGLDPVRGREALEEYRTFLLWVEDKLRTAGIPAGEVGLQWFRGGYRSRGLEWYGLQRAGLDEPTKAQWAQDLDEWNQQPWFAQWRAVNLDGLARVRMGPHCWFSFFNLRAVNPGT